MKVLTTMAIKEVYLDRLEDAYPGIHWRICRTTGEALEYLPRADVLVTYGEGLTPQLLKRAEKLRWIHSMSAGLENIPFQALIEREIQLTNVRGIHRIQVAEHTLGVMLSFVRQLPFFTRMQELSRWEYHVKFDELFEQTVTIVGLGALGQEIAARCRAFGMRVTGVNTDGRDVEGVHKVYPTDQLRRALSEADFVVVTVPLVEKTENLIGEAELDAMKKSAIFINVARGKVVDQKVLIQFLEEGRIAGAALDVFEKEPLSENNPLWKMHNVLITPHVAGRSPRYMERAMEVFETNLKAFIEEKPLPLNVIDLERGY
ncbi:D-2-hydroxyacid dehydrogenase [Heliorestis acidaminivorans]|uniref:D-2-hydroxyacid dehydrogenase n=1 Tax=Heliorestis acidaminivorans TaxID=553427 RepID=A0A6I0F1U2_9FIRM|nr:D-2-hydroxyacid dehydrogenase [Heliorestis acidaminivorans]KAB2952381.1 D-2-hydroxyacid dehydrogenase [Heliorestis acidaminivorans]